MTKPKTNSYKSKSPREAASSSSKTQDAGKKGKGKGAKKEENTGKSPGEPWSAWIWENDLDLFYRARFREDSK